GNRTLGPSTVVCPRPGGSLSARAETTLTATSLEVDRSWTDVRIEPVAGGGIRSTVTAVARGVDFGGELRIGEIRSTAVSFSNGRPRRKDLSTHTVEIAGVSLGTTVLCARTCSDRELVEMERTLNTAANGRAVFRTGKGPNSGLDTGLVEGSPKGAQTAVQKSVARQASDRALVGDFNVDVPAFEVTVYNDNPDAGGWGRARQVYQFAGVASSATYNIVNLPTVSGLPLADEPATDAMEAGDLVGLAFADDGGSGGGGGNPTFGTATVATGRGDRPSGWTGSFVAVARGLRVLLADPRRGVLLLAVWALLGLPGVLARRRRLLLI
ncbi:MAG TPA: hypothetical protein VGB03_00835, partial [Acidimicrobiales bacterium]